METLDHPPFPPPTWDGDSWTAELTLASWAGFQIRHGDHLAARDASTADGTARLSIVTADGEARTPPTPEQATAFRHLLDNEAAVAEAVAGALVRYCPGEAYDGDDDVLWEVSEPGDLRPLIRLAGVHVPNVVSDGVAYIGFEFDCAWDPEHGAGVMTHRGRVVATGQGDVSFTEWIARHGLDKQQKND
jgi:hypothetical protein